MAVRDPTKHRVALAELIVELSGVGIMQPIKLAKLGFIVEQTASLGISGGMKVIWSVIRNIIWRMDKAQLLSISGSIRKFMR